MPRANFFRLLAISCLLAAPARPQARSQMTARELFHAPAEPPAAAKAKPSRAQPGQPSPVLVSAPSVPLGLRYSILKEVRPGAAAEVDPDTVFRSGDRIRLSFEANADAYLYVVQRGSSGNWSVLFPSAEVEGGNNAVRRGVRYEIPAGYWFAFDEQPGQEKLFLVLSRQPEANLERLIYSVQETPARPAQSSKTLLALNAPVISDALMGRLREQVFTRDLVFEKVTDKTAGDRDEKAVYVVNPAGGAAARVVADLILKHQ